MKTPDTVQLERDIYWATHKMGVFGCHEVTIGFGGNERVDFMTFDTNGIWRCYEIKTSVADFHSKASKTFIGHFNYFVLTQAVYDAVKGEIPKHIGVYVGQQCVKAAKRQPMDADNVVLLQSMIRSLSRQYLRGMRLGRKDALEAAERMVAEARRLTQGSQKEANEWFKMRSFLRHTGQMAAYEAFWKIDLEV